MRTKVVLIAAAIVMLIISTVAIGSNMGFKISIQLTAGYSNFVSLPYFNSYTNAQSLFNDIPNVSSVSRWNNATGLWETWIGFGNNFAITPGECYVVKVRNNATWVVVGSHNPSLALPLTAGYSNFVSVPYHTTATNAQSLFNQIPNVSSVSRWNNATGLWESWIGFGNNFAITPGEGLVVKVRTTSTWAPAHF